MKIPILFIASIFMLTYIVYIGYIPWIKPQEYLRSIQKRRRKMKKGFLPFPANLTNDFLIYNPKLDLWWMRSTTIFGVVFCIIAIVISI